MSRRVFVLESALTLVVVSLLSSRGAQAQNGISITPGKIVKWLDAQGDLTDSAISEDPTTGNISIGTTSPSNLTVVGSGISLSRSGASAQILVESSGGGIASFSAMQDGNNTILLRGDNGNSFINTGGNVGIGTTSPSRTLTVVGNGISVSRSGASAQISVESSGGGIASFSAIQDGANTILLRGDNGNSFINTGGNVGIGTVSPSAKLDVVGVTKTSVLQITGGSDFSEKFEVANAQSHLKPGMVVALDPKNPGKLAVSARAYDRRVAGVISGAGGVQPGMLMGQSGTLADGDQPVALSGRVYVWADASNAPIAVGDPLTTSNLAGYAMKVSDYRKAQGATIGKAMTELPQGRGLVLTLVTLQ